MFQSTPPRGRRLSTLERKLGLVLVSPKETPAPAPEGQRHVAWGVSPRDRSTKPPRSPERATAVPSIRRAAVAPSGLWDSFGPPSWGSRPRLHAVAPSEPGLLMTRFRARIYVGEHLDHASAPDQAARRSRGSPPGGDRSPRRWTPWVVSARSALVVAVPVMPNDSDVVGRGINVVAGAAQLVIADVGAGRGGPGGRTRGALQGRAVRRRLLDDPREQRD